VQHGGIEASRVAADDRRRHVLEDVVDERQAAASASHVGLGVREQQYEYSQNITFAQRLFVIRVR